MFDWIRSRKQAYKQAEESEVLVFLNPLAMLLAAAEKNKGSALTKEEVLSIRDNAQCIKMPIAQAKKFYASLDAQFVYPRINPDSCWEEWQALRNEK